MKPLLIFLSALFLSAPRFAEAGWSWSLGYNNPPGASVGLNFMYLWSNWAFEFGLGSANSSSTNNNNSGGSSTTTATVGGDLNFKYLFSSGVFRPYLQVGSGAGIGVSSGSSTGASAGIAGGFAGGGIFIIGNPIYVYLSYNMGGQSFYQGGLGFDF